MAPNFFIPGLIGTVPFLLLLAAQPLMEKPGWRRWYAAGLVLPMIVIGMVGYWLDINGFKSTTMAAIDRIRAEWQPGDILYSSNDGNWVMFSLYQDNPGYLMPQCADHDRGALSNTTRQAMGVMQLPINAIPHTGRTWFLWNWGAPTSECNRDKATAMVGQVAPWWLVDESQFMSAGIWLLP